MSCGGFKAPENADQDVQGIIDGLKSDVETRLGSTFNLFEALTYTTQVVAGVNYIVKTKVDNDGTCIHLKIHKPLPHTRQPPSLMDVAQGHTTSSSIDFF
jgi:hypothetical protein